ncbi:MAG: TrbI/VirB10 family protein [Acidobacteriaceae bacterium]|nr:TrbI/VirB10 family protein [Acidobacteriaceae bacterium]
MEDRTTETKQPADVPVAVELEAAENLQGPAGLDLNPEPANGRRLSKKVGLLGVFFMVAIVLLIVVGIWSRGQKNKAVVGGGGEDNKSVTAATTMGKELEQNLEEQHSAAVKSLQDDGVEAAGPGPSMPANGQLVPPLRLKSTEINVPKLPEQGPGGRGRDDGSDRNRTEIMGGRSKTAEEKRREDLYKMEQEALVAPTGTGSKKASIGSGSGLLGQVSSAMTDPLSNLVSQARSMLSGSSGTAALPVAMSAKQDTDPNMQDRKESFVSSARTSAPKNYLDAVRTQAVTRYEVKAGWDIPATLEQAVNSDLPGELKALVRENVYDTATGRYLLIPQGSRVVGTYDAHVAYGQSRVQVIWNHLIFPDGSSINLSGMVGQDAQGASGFHDKVDHHYARMFGMALLTSAFSAGIQMTQGNQSSGSYGYPTNQQIATQALGQQMGELGMEIARRNMDVQPTIKVPVGYRFNIRVNRDIAFSEPYGAMAR